jgi:uncharacterized protein
MKKLIPLIIIMVLGYYIKSQNQALEKSLLWEVTGKGLKAPSYLFGTIHMLCEKDYLIKPKVLKAFDSCKSLAVEINMLDTLEMLNAQKMMFSNTKMSEALSKREAYELDSILQKDFNINLAVVDNYRPIRLISMMVVKAASCSNIKMLDMELMKTANAKEMKILNFETITGQMEMLEKATPIGEIVTQMKLGNEYSPLFSKMVEHYKDENILELDRILKDKRFMNEDAEKVMLTDRNLDWAEKMPKIMEANSTFMAFGAGHLTGEYGMINLLRKKGYTVKPIIE